MSMIDIFMTTRKKTKLPYTTIARLLEVKVETIYQWIAKKHIPKKRHPQIQALIDNLTHQLDNGKLPIDSEELLYKGLLHYLEGENNGS